MIHQILLLVTCCFYAITRTEAVNFNNPIKPQKWQQLAGTGFSTTYFKTTNVVNKYNPKNIQDVYNRGFRNLRLRCRTGLDDLDMATFLEELNMIVDKCLEVGVVPIISWINHVAEAEGKDSQMDDYVDWWTRVAVSLKDKDYRLAFNLFTELGVESKCGKKDCNTKQCPFECGESLAENIGKYNKWTRKVIPAIRKAGGKNKNRILILGSPAKTGDALQNIPRDIYKYDDFIMAEWHIYASGPNRKKKRNGRPTIKYWGIVKGQDVGKSNVDQALQYAKDWTKATGVSTYFGAWMPQDNEKGQITTAQAKEFSKYLVEKLKPLPWSLNVLDVYYDTKRSKWKTGKQTIKGQKLDMPAILRVIVDTMKKPTRKDESFEDIPRMNQFLDVTSDDGDMRSDYKDYYGERDYKYYYNGRNDKDYYGKRDHKDYHGEKDYKDYYGEKYYKDYYVK